MLVIKPIETLPANFAQFKAEMVPEYRGIYGQKATDKYENAIESQLTASLVNANVIAFATFDRRRVVGIIVAQIKSSTGQVAFVHTLRDHAEGLVSSNLIQRVVEEVRSRGVSQIIIDTIPLCALNIAEVLGEMGFRTIERMLMTRTLHTLPANTTTTELRNFNDGDLQESAALLFEAFRTKSEPVLYNEMSDIDNALHMLRHYRDGGYGIVQPEWARLIHKEDEILGIALGTSVSDDVGFILQVAVLPTFQGTGFGTQLVYDLLARFQNSGMQEALLGVTKHDLAYLLYKRLGFVDKRSVSVHVWGAG